MRRGTLNETRPPVPDGPYLVVGLGQSGLAAVEALAATSGAGRVRVWDDSASTLARSLRRSLARRGIALTRDRATALDGVRTVVKSPGIARSHAVLEAARGRGIAVMDELELGWRQTARPVVAVTGTNGKSTTSTLVHATLEAAGRRPVLAGNVDDRGSPLSAIPPDHDGWVVAEVSSYQAEGCPAFLPTAAALTNLTEDHLHRHGSMAAYAAAKRQIFVRGGRCVDLAVLNADDAFGRRLADEVRARGGQVSTFGLERPAEYRVRAIGSTLRSGRVEIDAPGGLLRIGTRLPGAHNAANVAAALALADGLGLPRESSLEALATMRPVPGRFEPIDAGQPFHVIVDFAHSPDGVTRALATARELVGGHGGQLIVVMSGVAWSHRATREATGRAARAGADHLILCASSYGGQPRVAALEWLLAGARQADGGTLEVVLERRDAIARAVARARPGDLVAILGRGSLTRVAYDARGGLGTLDDRLVARELLAELGRVPVAA